MRQVFRLKVIRRSANQLSAVYTEVATRIRELEPLEQPELPL
jgi:hypothetical protein